MVNSKTFSMNCLYTSTIPYAITACKNIYLNLAFKLNVTECSNISRVGREVGLIVESELSSACLLKVPQREENKSFHYAANLNYYYCRTSDELLH
jgi:hypothetical protein